MCSRFKAKQENNLPEWETMMEKRGKEGIDSKKRLKEKDNKVSQKKGKIKKDNRTMNRNLV